MKHSLTIKKILFKSGVMALVRKVTNPANDVAILRYHAIVDPEKNFYASPSICIRPDVFSEQIKYISSHYNVISLDTVADCIETNTPFPDNAVVITFDDGYKDNFYASKILKKYNVTGTFYIASDCIGANSVFWLFEIIYLLKNTSKKSIFVKLDKDEKVLPLATADQRQASIRDVVVLIKSNNRLFREEIRKQIQDQTKDVTDFMDKSRLVMLTWDQVNEMHQDGMTIGGHTMTHLNLPNADPDDAFDEIYECKKLIENKINTTVDHFSYPNGGNYDYYNSKIVQMVKKAGYRTATTSINGVSDRQTDLFELERIRITPNLAEIVYQIDCEKLFN